MFDPLEALLDERDLLHRATLLRCVAPTVEQWLAPLGWTVSVSDGNPPVLRARPPEPCHGAIELVCADDVALELTYQTSFLDTGRRVVRRTVLSSLDPPWSQLFDALDEAVSRYRELAPDVAAHVAKGGAAARDRVLAAHLGVLLDPFMDALDERDGLTATVSVEGILLLRQDDSWVATGGRATLLTT